MSIKTLAHLNPNGEQQKTLAVCEGFLGISTRLVPMSLVQMASAAFGCVAVPNRLAVELAFAGGATALTVDDRTAGLRFHATTETRHFA